MHALFRSIRHKPSKYAGTGRFKNEWCGPPRNHVHLPAERGIQNEWITSELSSWNSIDSPRGSRISLARTTSGPFGSRWRTPPPLLTGYLDRKTAFGARARRSGIIASP